MKIFPPDYPAYALNVLGIVIVIALVMPIIMKAVQSVGG